jgi:membrane protein YqaA with SNARE-associated domain
MYRMQVKIRGLRWHHYVSILGVLAVFIVLPMVALIYFQDEIKQAQAYGYAGVFAVGLLCGISIIPAPTQLLVFTFGHVLNPIWVGLIAGLGSATGGVTVYLTGAGAQTMWSRFRSRELALQQRLGLPDSTTNLEHSKSWSKWKGFYDKLVEWISGKKGAWALFVTSAIVISPFYPAGLAAGSLGMGLAKFFLITWAGKTVRYLYVALAGYWGLQFISNLLK